MRKLSEMYSVYFQPINEKAFRSALDLEARLNDKAKEISLRMDAAETDEEYDILMAEHEKVLDAGHEAHMTAHDSQISSIKPSEWEASFLSSFIMDEGKTKRVSDKQKNILLRFCKDYGRENYLFRYAGLIWELSVHSRVSYIKTRKSYY